MRSRRQSRLPQQIYIKTTPAIPANANIRHILANVAKTEGPFEDPANACKAALMALHDDAWYATFDNSFFKGFHQFYNELKKYLNID
jgi:hypothetical protein